MSVRGRRAFTLIEIMIGIAILAILMAVPITFRNGFGWLNRESDYRWALRNARWTLEELRAAPFDTLPPRVVTPVGDRIRLQPDLVADSVTVADLEGDACPISVDAVRGFVTVGQYGNRPYVVDYAFHAADRGEAHTVPPTCRVALDNAPVVHVDRVLLARGDALDSLTGWTLSGSDLVLPRSAAGRVVRVDYAGGRVRNRVSGQFLDERLQPTDQPGPFKLLRIEESYGGSGRLALTLLRAAP